MRRIFITAVVAVGIDAMKSYRLQFSTHNGVVNRAFGGRKASWGKWITWATYPSRSEAEEAFESRKWRGVNRWRIMYGSSVIRKSL